MRRDDHRDRSARYSLQSRGALVEGTPHTSCMKLYRDLSHLVVVPLGCHGGFTRQLQELVSLDEGYRVKKSKR